MIVKKNIFFCNFIPQLPTLTNKQKIFISLVIIQTLGLLLLRDHYITFKQGLYNAKLFFGLFLSYLIVPSRLEKPSDFYLLILILIPLMSFIFYGATDLTLYWQGLLLIIFPIIAIKYCPDFKSFEMKPVRLNLSWLAYVLSIFSLLLLIYCISTAEYELGFDFENSYVRRLASRQAFQSGSIVAYALSISSNMIVPLTSFLFAGSKLLLAIPIAIAFMMFFLMGSKAAFGYIVIAVLLGILNKKNKLHRLWFWVLMLFIVISIVAVLERVAFGTDFVVDRTYHRIFLSLGNTIQKYLVVMNSYDEWNLLQGCQCNEGASYLVGRIFSGSAANENTNAFVHSIADKGILIYLTAIFLICLINKWLDSCWRKLNNGFFIYTAIFLAILTAEQSIFTSLITSGVIFLLVLNLLVSLSPANPQAGIGGQGFEK